MNDRLYWSDTWRLRIVHIASFLICCLGWFVLLYMLVQMYFWFNPGGDGMFFYNMIDKY